MRIEEAVFRVRPDHHKTFSVLLTRTELMLELKKYMIERSYGFGYSIPPGQLRVLKNIFGKPVEVKRELSFEQRRIASLNP